MDESFKNRWINFIHQSQDDICHQVEIADGDKKFEEDRWQRDGGGGGKTRVLQNGNVFEKAAVNTSVVFGKMGEKMVKALHLSGESWFACGLSLIFHPVNPFLPTIHANWRYFELYDHDDGLISCWFGGGIDLTPYYIFEEDVVHFHKTLCRSLQPFGASLYDEYKKNCDEYFINKHRNNEARGVGGIFYDRLCPADEAETERYFAMQQSISEASMQSYLPIVSLRKNLAWAPQHKYWQEIRRGRYVEFNLLHDKGTLFGLKSNGRIESILASLPPTVRYDYNFIPAPGSEEEKLLHICQKPKDWI